MQAPTDGPCRIGIVGGGAAGIACAISALRRIESELDVVVFEPRERLGEGVAYATRDAEHLLNVRAANMSIHADQPDSFRQWADAAPASYLPRRDYAAYLHDELERAQDARGLTVEHVRAEVQGIEQAAGGYLVHDSAGAHRLVDFVILATGNERPSLPAQIAVDVGADVYIVRNPWEPGSGTAGRTLVIGSGLTAVDVCLTTLAHDSDATVRLVSRRGMLPAVHDDPWQPPFPVPLFTAADFQSGMTLGAALKAIRATGEDWRRAMDALRPVTQGIWLSLTRAQREQFVRHLMRYWDVHRHRMAPRVGRMMSDWQTEGRLDVVAADVSSIQDAGIEAAVHACDGRCWVADRVVVATGPADWSGRNGLLAHLRDQGLVQDGPLGSALPWSRRPTGSSTRLVASANRCTCSALPRRACSLSRLPCRIFERQRRGSASRFRMR